MSKDVPSKTGKSYCPTDKAPRTGRKNNARGKAINRNRPAQPSVRNQMERNNMARFSSNHKVAAALPDMNPKYYDDKEERGKKNKDALHGFSLCLAILSIRIRKRSKCNGCKRYQYRNPGNPRGEKNTVSERQLRLVKSLEGVA